MALPGGNGRGSGGNGGVDDGVLMDASSVSDVCRSYSTALYVYCPTSTMPAVEECRWLASSPWSGARQEQEKGSGGEASVLVRDEVTLVALSDPGGFQTPLGRAGRRRESAS